MVHADAEAPALAVGAGCFVGPAVDVDAGAGAGLDAEAATGRAALAMDTRPGMSSSSALLSERRMGGGRGGIGHTAVTIRTT